MHNVFNICAFIVPWGDESIKIETFLWGLDHSSVITGLVHGNEKMLDVGCLMVVKMLKSDTSVGQCYSRVV